MSETNHEAIYSTRIEEIGIMKERTIKYNGETYIHKGDILNTLKEIDAVVVKHQQISSYMKQVNNLKQSLERIATLAPGSMEAGIARDGLDVLNE